MPRLPLEPCSYEKELNSKQKENFNAAKLAGVLSDFGYSCIRLSDDWSGADLIAIHKSGAVYKIQLKGRFGFWERYREKDLFMAFRVENDWWVYPHDELLECVSPNFLDTPSWKTGSYTYPTLSVENRRALEPYRITAINAQPSTSPKP